MRPMRPESSHALVFDKLGNLWFANGTEGSPTKFDPETGRIFLRKPATAGLPILRRFHHAGHKRECLVSASRKVLSSWIH